jgi:type IV pilus assembly protein PilX
MMAISLRKQSGAALLVALLILVVISLIGISAMKSSIFTAKVATGTQADAMVFEGAETALSETYKELNSLPGEDFYALLNDNFAERCVVQGAVPYKKSVCTANDRFDSRELLQVASSSSLQGFSPVSGSQVSTTGGGVIFVDYKVAMLGESRMESFGLENFHLQEALKRGIKPGSEIE